MFQHRDFKTHAPDIEAKLTRDQFFLLYGDKKAVAEIICSDRFSMTRRTCRIAKSQKSNIEFQAAVEEPGNRRNNKNR